MIIMNSVSSTVCHSLHLLMFEFLHSDTFRVVTKHTNYTRLSTFCDRPRWHKLLSLGTIVGWLPVCLPVCLTSKQLLF